MEGVVHLLKGNQGRVTTHCPLGCSTTDRGTNYPKHKAMLIRGTRPFLSKNGPLLNLSLFTTYYKAKTRLTEGEYLPITQKIKRK
uniref:Uncharacterized protein n=1 Tax=Daucus carota subsp. sativus TaxID=79200 RepID=A0A161ZZ03_DAUCS